MANSGSSINKLYLRYFLVFGLTFGLLSILWDFIKEEKADIEKIIFISVIFGALMAWRTVAFRKTKSKK